MNKVKRRSKVLTVKDRHAVLQVGNGSGAVSHLPVDETTVVSLSEPIRSTLWYPNLVCGRPGWCRG